MIYGCFNKLSDYWLAEPDNQYDSHHQADLKNGNCRKENGADNWPFHPH